MKRIELFRSVEPHILFHTVDCSLDTHVKQAEHVNVNVKYTLMVFRPNNEIDVNGILVYHSVSISQFFGDAIALDSTFSNILFLALNVNQTLFALRQC